jgi:hypothetical protein
MTQPGGFVRSLLPWIAIVFISASLGYTMNNAIAGGSVVQQPCATIVGGPMSVGLDSWVVAESQRAACTR